MMYDDTPARFTLAAYLRDRWISVLLLICALLGVWGMCAVLGIDVQGCTAIVVYVFLLFCAALCFDYLKRWRYWRAVQTATEEIQELAQALSLLQKPRFLEAGIASDFYERASDVGNAELTDARREMVEYRDYIELWIHETKTPIAAAKLVLARMSGPDADALSRELERIENQVDQALYYARSMAVENDYAIRPVKLAETIREACKRQARFLIEQQAIPHVEVADDTEVLSDKPWLVFMLGQVIANAAQYGASNITFTAHTQAEDTAHGRTVLEVCDDGAGISEADIQRVFERGFTGENGRARGNATGMGLYLISLMCERLGMSISLASEQGTGTRVTFAFPHDKRHLNHDARRPSI